MSKTKSVPFTFQKDGYYYFTRRVPSDLKNHYQSPRIVEALRTNSASVARVRAMVAASKLDEFWSRLRISTPDVPGRQLLRDQFGGGALASTGRVVSVSADQSGDDTPLLSEAVANYIRVKGHGRGKAFKAAAERSCGYLIDVSGEKSIAAYTRSDALKLRDFLLSKGLTGSSITRVFGSVRSVFNLNISELALDLRNPFTGVYYDRSQGVKDRQTIPVDVVRRIQKMCRKTDDEKRWLMAMVSDTGARLAEIAGLAREDIKLSASVPHIVIQAHPWRSLKTQGSARVVPLVGAALWAAQRVCEAPDGGCHAFPSYNKASTTNANSASAALNKWIRTQTKQSYSMHGFRHAMRDRLRAIECPADVVDQIGGWTTDGVGHSYGQGYPLEVMQRWMLELSAT